MSDEVKKPHGVGEAVSLSFEADAAKSAASKGRTLKVRRIGNSLGVVLPKEVLAKLNVGEGAELTVTETPVGVTLSPYDEGVAEQIEIMRDLMQRYRNTLRELAK